MGLGSATRDCESVEIGGIWLGFRRGRRGNFLDVDLESSNLIRVAKDLKIEMVKVLMNAIKVTFQLSLAFLGPTVATSFNSTCLVDNCLSISVFCLALLPPMSPSRLSWSERRLGGESPCSFLALTRKTTSASGSTSVRVNVSPCTWAATQWPTPPLVKCST